MGRLEFIVAQNQDDMYYHQDISGSSPSMQFSLQVIFPPKPSGFIYSEDEEKWFWLVFLLWLYASEYLSPDSLFMVSASQDSFVFKHCLWII